MALLLLLRCCCNRDACIWQPRPHGGAYAVSVDALYLVSFVCCSEGVLLLETSISSRSSSSSSSKSAYAGRKARGVAYPLRLLCVCLFVWGLLLQQLRLLGIGSLCVFRGFRGAAGPRLRAALHEVAAHAQSVSQQRMQPHHRGSPRCFCHCCRQLRPTDDATHLCRLARQAAAQTQYTLIPEP